jgi:dihydroorotate dehydrogenase
MQIQRAVYRYILRPILFKTCPEFAHDVVKKIAQILQVIPGGTWFLSVLYQYEDEILNTTVDGIDYANPLLISAGFDKTGVLPPVVHNLGFGGIELGSFSKHAHPGNPGVRLWRAVKSQSINVYYGLNNDGSEYVAKHVAPEWAKAQAAIGVSGSATNGVIGEADATDDLLTTYERLGGYGDYFTINLSCPNLGVDNPYYDLGNLEKLLVAVKVIRERNGWQDKPVMCKIGPDHTDNEIRGFIDVMHRYSINGILTCNLTKNRKLVPENDRATYVVSDWQLQKRIMPYDRGGMSGALLRPMTNHITRICAQHVKDKGYNFTIVSIGGCDSAEDAYLKIRSGASLIHLITTLIYDGPQQGRDINRGLAELLRRDGFNSIAEAVGADLD